MGERKLRRKFNEFVVSATVGLGRRATVLSSHRSSHEQAMTLIFELHQDDLLRTKEQCGVGMIPGKYGSEAQAEAR